MSGSVAMLVQPSADGRFDGLAGFELVGISPLDPEDPRHAFHLEQALQRQAEFRRSALNGCGRAWLELHYLGLPDGSQPWRSTLRIALFVGARGSDRAS
ncbi:MAG: hypothetical protein FJ125_11665 [Deltaproteobacteria bacterium]|nr:hypothetical protein [Deltaproteobacteria bacterium]